MSEVVGRYTPTTLVMGSISWFQMVVYCVKNTNCDHGVLSKAQFFSKNSGGALGSLKKLSDCMLLVEFYIIKLLAACSSRF